MIYAIFALNLVVTSAVEGALIYLMFRRRNYVYYSLLCNLLTNPAVNLLLFLMTGAIGTGLYYPCLIILEILAVLMEAWIYRMLCPFTMKKAAGLSLLLNLVSYLCGFLLYQLF
jgi:hypothetical protein